MSLDNLDGQITPGDLLDLGIVTRDAKGRLQQNGGSVSAATDTDGRPLAVITSSPWGVDATGRPYYDSAGADAGEEAVLMLDSDTATLQVVTLA